MEIQMALFEAKADAVASALTPLILVASFHSALSQENSVTAPARLATQDGIFGFLLVHSDIAYADGDQSIEGAALWPVQTASQSKNKLAKAVDQCTSIARRKEDRTEGSAACTTQKKLLGHARD
jgi:hypothetical protein